MNAAALEGGEFLDTSDKKREVKKKKGLSPSKKDQLLYEVADNKRRRNEELFPSLLLRLRVSL